MSRKFTWANHTPFDASHGGASDDRIIILDMGIFHGASYKGLKNPM